MISRQLYWHGVLCFLLFITRAPGYNLAKIFRLTFSHGLGSTRLQHSRNLVPIVALCGCLVDICNIGTRKTTLDLGYVAMHCVFLAPMGIYTALQMPLTVPYTAQTSGKLPAVCAVQGGCESVYEFACTPPHPDICALGIQTDLPIIRLTPPPKFNQEVDE